MTKKIEQIRIFISSPSDVNAEKELALKVIEELNRTLCESNGLTLFPFTWEKNTYPAIGNDPQDVINKQIGDYDIFVGIMANRFGTPTHRAGSGTEEEYNIAFENRDSKEIMFFFKDGLTQPSSLDLKQLKKVNAFKQKITNDNGVLYKQFAENFENIFRDSFTLLLSNKYINRLNKESIDNISKTMLSNIDIDIDKYFQYRNPTYEKYSNLNALAIPNSQFKLKDIYVAQTLVKDNRFEDNKETTKIDKLPVDLIKKYRKILITDTAGMGKSTIMKFMFVDLVENKIKDIGIPIYIELNRLNKERTILQEIQTELKSISKEHNKSSLPELIQQGGFVFFLDGYDEISISDRIEVTRDIQTFISDAGNDNYYILTSRPEENLSCFGEFQSFTIKPLTKKEAFELLSKYDIGKGKEVSKKLIGLLKSGDYNSIDEYLENPLLVSLLYAAFNHKNTIPLKKHLFYSQVYEALYDAFDLSKGIEPHSKRTGLDIDDFRKVLKCIAYICLEKTGVKFDKETILKIIGRAKDFCAYLDFKEYDFLKDLLSAVPLFSKDGNEYKWAHKSLMEYFAARFIADEAKENQNKILNDIYNSDDIYKYINLLELYYDIDNLGFVKNIEKPLLNEYIKHYDSNMYESSKIDKKLIEERIGYLYAQNIIIDNVLIVRLLKKEVESVNETVDFLDNSIHEVFIQYRECIEMKHGIKITGATIKNDSSYIGYYHQSSHRVIMELLSRRKGCLFEQPGDFYVGKSSKKYDLEILNCHTGEKNKKDYMWINSMLVNHRFDTYPNIHKCREELKRINNIINKNKNNLSLIEGF